MLALTKENVSNWWKTEISYAYDKQNIKTALWKKELLLGLTKNALSLSYPNYVLFNKLK